MKAYYNKINETNSNGAIFMAVMRGRISEGLDFADMYGRAVMIIGLPLPSYDDPKVVLKKKYLDCSHQRNNNIISGDGWYNLEAFKAVNQAIGRVIRHKNDYGAILLCEDRFEERRFKENLPSWIKIHLNSQATVNTSFNKIIDKLTKFFEERENSN